MQLTQILSAVLVSATTVFALPPAPTRPSLIWAPGPVKVTGTTPTPRVEVEVFAEAEALAEAAVAGIVGRWMSHGEKGEEEKMDMEVGQGKEKEGE